MSTPQITPLPTPPTRQDPVNFAQRADSFLAQLPTFATEANTLALATNTRANDAANAANAASDSANAALLSANAASDSANAALGSANNAQGFAQDAQRVLVNIEDVEKRYLGAKSVDPLVDNQGGPLQAGMLYFNTVTNFTRVYNGFSWQDTASAVNGTSKRQTFTATAGQTTFVISGGYDAGFADVFLNGAKLVNAVDVNVSSGTDVVLAFGANAGDTVDVIAFGSFVVADAVAKSGDTMTGTLTVPQLNVAGLIDYKETVEFVSANIEALRSRTYVLLSGVVLTLPSNPSIGDWVGVVNRSGTTTAVVARGGSLILGLAEDFEVDLVNFTARFVYTDATNGWIIN